MKSLRRHGGGSVYTEHSPAVDFSGVCRVGRVSRRESNINLGDMRRRGYEGRKETERRRRKYGGHITEGDLAEVSTAADWTGSSSQRHGDRLRSCGSEATRNVVTKHMGRVRQHLESVSGLRSTVARGTVSGDANYAISGGRNERLSRGAAVQHSDCSHLLQATKFSNAQFGHRCESSFVPESFEARRSTAPCSPGTGNHEGLDVRTDRRNRLPTRVSGSTVAVEDIKSPVGLFRGGEASPRVEGRTIRGRRRRREMGLGFPRVEGRSFSRRERYDAGVLRTSSRAAEESVAFLETAQFVGDDDLRSFDGPVEVSGPGDVGALHQARIVATSAVVGSVVADHSVGGQTLVVEDIANVSSGCRGSRTHGHTSSVTPSVRALQRFPQRPKRIRRTLIFDSSPDADIVQILPRSVNTESIGVSPLGERGLVRPEDPVSYNGELAYLPSHRVNMMEALLLAKEVHLPEEDLMLLRLMNDDYEPDELFESLPLPRHKFSRRMLRHLKKLTDAGVVEAGEVICSMGLFTVPKKNMTLRLIQNGKYINTFMKAPPKMKLPLLPDYIREVLKHSYAAVCDSVCFFYQLGLPESLRKYFGVKLAGERGRMFQGRMTVLPMGWSWSPAIAQTLSNALVDGIGIAWVDNYVIFGDTLEEFERNKETFLNRLRRLNVIIDDYALEPKQIFTSVGVRFDLVNKLVQLESSKDLPVSPSMSPLQVYEVMGSLVWFYAVQGRALCHKPESMALLGKAARKAVSDWDGLFDLTAKQLSELTEWAAERRANLWVAGHKTAPAATVEVWTDASDTHAAYVAFKKSKVVARSHWLMKKEVHIFLKELETAVCAIEAVPKEVPSLHVDNMPVVLALKKKLSTNFEANRMMSRIADREFHVQWVSTSENVVDPFTRGVAINRASSLEAVLKLHQQFRDDLESSGAKDGILRRAPQGVVSSGQAALPVATEELNGRERVWSGHTAKHQSRELFGCFGDPNKRRQQWSSCTPAKYIAPKSQAQCARGDPTRQKKNIKSARSVPSCVEAT